MVACVCFNEAPAIPPGRGGAAGMGVADWQERFNEAPAIPPGRVPVAVLPPPLAPP